MKFFCVLIVNFGFFFSLCSGWSAVISKVFSNKQFNNDKAISNSIVAGAQMAYYYCQEQFKWDRWNCPDTAFYKKNLQLANKESAFVRAILFAAVIHTIARNCSREELDCPCRKYKSSQAINNQSQLENLEHQKHINNALLFCNEQNINFAENIFIEYLIDIFHLAGDLHTHIYLQNGILGRLAVKTNMKKYCHCVGQTENCNTQICQNELAPFGEIATNLRKLYNKAIRIDYQNNVQFKLPISSDRYQDFERLIYLDESPNYCLPNVTIGWTGTVGRLCLKKEGNSLSERRSCKNICRECGHKVAKQTEIKKWRCNCSFKWCCEVTCKTCIENVNHFFCESSDKLSKSLKE